MSLVQTIIAFIVALGVFVWLRRRGLWGILR